MSRTQIVTGPDEHAQSKGTDYSINLCILKWKVKTLCIGSLESSQQLCFLILEYFPLSQTVDK